MRINALTHKKYFHIIAIIVILAIVLFALGIIVLKYQVEGETNMPFKLSKISVISSCGGINKDAADTKWAFDVFQSNDIYLYIDKNDSYEKTEAIKSISVNNIQIEAKNKENIKIYKPDEKEEKNIFNNNEENIVENIEYVGDLESNIKGLKISNQGGLVVFRCLNRNVAEYMSNDEEIVHTELLKKAGVNPEDIKMKLTFDLSITLEGGKEYQSTITLDCPVENVIEEGTTSKEITDVKDFIFKRNVTG